MEFRLIRAIQVREAVTSITTSALRNQGKAGVIDVVRNFLSNLNMRRFGVYREATFKRKLDVVTRELMRAMPKDARSFGAARKALNIYLRNASYNCHMREFFGLSQLDEWGEVPIDSVVVREMKAKAGRGKLPRWHGVKNLTPQDNEVFQAYAADMAKEMKIQRIHLDTYLWVQGRKHIYNK